MYRCFAYPAKAIAFLYRIRVESLLKSGGTHNRHRAEIASMRRLGLLYDGCLRRSPMLTKSFTSTVLFGLGDRIAQRIEKSCKTEEECARLREIDDSGAFISKSIARTMRMMIWGSVFFTPIAHAWVNFVELTVGSHGKVVVLKKVLLDMFVFAPSINTLFFTATQVMNGRSLCHGIDFAVDRLPQTLKVNYMIWPFANIINYSCVPLQYRILFINCVSLVWTTVLSSISSQPVIASNSKGECCEEVMEC